MIALRATLLVLALASLGVTAQGQAPAGKDAGKPAEEKRFRFSFDNRPWSEVIEYLVDQTEMPFISHVTPTGRVTFQPPKGKDGKEPTYTIGEFFDIVNDLLEPQGLVMYRRTASFTCWPIGEKIPVRFIPDVTKEALEQRGKSEFVIYRLELKNLKAADFIAKAKVLISPVGDVRALPESNELVIRDWAPNVRAIAKMVQEADAKK